MFLIRDPAAFTPIPTMRILQLIRLGAFAGILPLAGAQDVLYEFQGASSSDQFGHFMAKAGDLDADGITDIIAASRFANGTSFQPPYVRAYSGRTGALLIEVSGQPNQRWYGSAVDGAGDVNGDGHEDFIVGNRGPVGGSTLVIGEAVVYSGLDGGILYVLRGQSIGDCFGMTVTGAGDLDGDGYGDVAVGATFVQGGSHGVVRAFSGRTGHQLWETIGVGHEQMGRGLDSVGDVNGDGVPDILTGSLVGELGFGYGRVRMLSGVSGAVLSVIEGQVEFENFGFDVGTAGDIDQDGVADFIVGGYSSVGLESRVRVYSGADNSLIHDIPGGGLPEFGQIVDGGADVTGDGVPDLLISSSGATQVFSGADASLVYTMTGVTTSTSFGSAAAMVGDLNGDGFAEFAVGAPRGNTVGPHGSGSGSVFVFSRVPESGGALCLGVANSTGSRAALTAASPSMFSAATVDLTLAATSLPPNISGMFIVSQDFQVVPGAGGSVGSLCIASLAMGRFSSNIVRANAFGALSFQPDSSAIPLSSNGMSGFVAAMPGETFNFQLWYRDFQGGIPVSNFSDAVTVTFR